MLTGNYHLQAGSPCIDAGDPTYPYDPDSTIADIGAFFFDQSWISDPHGSSQSTEFSLSQNYPNPFNPTTTIRFDLHRSDHIVLKIYNTLGREIITLVDANLSPGTYKVPFTAENLSSGIYFIQLTSSTHFQTIKTVLLK